MIGKLVKIDREITVTMCDNGFMAAFSGRTEGDDWSNAKVICENINDLMKYIEDANATPMTD